MNQRYMSYLSGIYTLYNSTVKKIETNLFVSIDCMFRNYQYNLFAK